LIVNKNGNEGNADQSEVKKKELLFKKRKPLFSLSDN